MMALPASPFGSNQLPGGGQGRNSHRRALLRTAGTWEAIEVCFVSFKAKARNAFAPAVTSGSSHSNPVQA